MLPPVRVKTCPDPRWGILAPFLAVLLIVGGTGIFVRVYHGSIEGDHKLDPAFPRAGRPFRIMIPPGSSGKKAATLLLVVTKESRSPYAPGRWPVPSTVMRLVLADSPNPAPLSFPLMIPAFTRSASSKPPAECPGYPARYGSCYQLPSWETRFFFPPSPWPGPGRRSWPAGGWPFRSGQNAG